MKRLLLLAACLAAPIFALADVRDRDVLLTPDGTIYTAEAQNTADGGNIVLTVQRGTYDVRTILPESQGLGARFAPALAFDTDSQTLFVFWLRMPNVMSSELLVSAYHDGKWEAPVSIDDKPFCFRFNLRIAVRHRVAQPQNDGSSRDVAGLVVHTVWWEQTGSGEVARYALVSIDKGAVANIELHDLAEFAPPGAPAPTDAAFNRELLKHPAIIDTGLADSVDVLFGDMNTNVLNRARLRPIADGRIHIPIGHGGGTRLGVPQAFSSDWSGQVSAVVAGHDDGTILLYNVASTSLNFVLYSHGTWAAAKSVPLNDRLSADAAIGALGRMLNQ
jgi:hypothetical protein